MLVTVILVVTGLVTAVWVYSRYHHNYWAARGVPTVPGYLPLLGHTHKLLSSKHPRWLFIDKVYQHHRGWRFCGLYEMLKPSLLVMDPELIKTLLIKDFDYFVDRRNIRLSTDRDAILNQILTRTKGEQWKALRSLLSPNFTSGKLKGMFPLVSAKADALVEHLHIQMDSRHYVPIRRSLGLYTMEVISSCAFGMEINALVEEDTLFIKMVHRMFKPTMMDIMKYFLFRCVPKLCEVLKISFTQPEMEFFKDVVRETMKQREEGGRRGDFLDFMMEAKEAQGKDSSQTSSYTVGEATVVANSILFILAGYDTTANTLSFVAFQLARHPEEQQRVRQELLDIIKEHGELSYQALMEAKLLDASILDRLTDSDLILSPGTMLSFPIWSLHHDPLYWFDPERFSLDRFLPHNKDKIKSGTFLPFGLGPRNCIGMRFALMEAKLALAKMLLKFELSCVPGREEVELSANKLGLLRPGDDLGVVFTPLY